MQHNARMEVGTIIYIAAINACDKRGECQLALSLFRTMVSPWSRGVLSALYASISACEKGYEWQLALGLLTVI